MNANLLLVPLALLGLPISSNAQNNGPQTLRTSVGQVQADKAKADKEKADKEKAEQAKAEQAKAEQAKAEQAKAEHGEAGQGEAEQAEAGDKAAQNKNVSPVQSAARPYDLDIVAPVQIAGSDEASRNFQENVLPDILKLVDQNLNDLQKKGGNKSLQALDSRALTLTNDAAARVYFLGEGAGNRNSLGVSTTGSAVFGKDAQLIFPDATIDDWGWGRSDWGPLEAGDFVDLGKLKAGTILDFFLIADGANGGKDFFSTDASLNSDGITHSVILGPAGSPYLVVSFEDIYGGGDLDYNDLVFAVYLGKENIKNMTALAAPEPSLAIGSLLSVIAIFALKRRR